MNVRNHWLLLLVALAASGCGSPAAEFRRYETYIFKMEREALPPQTNGQPGKFPESQLQNLDEVMQALYGTPDEPRLPAGEGLDWTPIADLAKLKLAAGPVGSDELGNARGLYREHCAHCHGITGDGFGPTAAFLNPYPRDYRKGWFKFKSTPIGTRPAHGDLKTIVLDGIPGTAMPSFKLLPDLEVEALVQYVKYLSIRGETERALLKALTEIEPELVLLNVIPENATAEQKAARDEQQAAMMEMVGQIVGNWAAAADQSTEVPARPAMTGSELVQSRMRGQAIFYGAVANCVKCHGESALGDGQTTDFDEWTKEFIADGKDKQLIAEYERRFLLPPRNILPRNLRLGVYRGGRRPVDLYWRISNGIEGVPMPKATMKPADDPHAKGLTEKDIWDLVNYVQSLPYESINNPLDAAREAENPRERL